MKGHLGTSSIYHIRLPEQWKLERMTAELSREARKRLRWIDHYLKHGNASLTSRYFGISRTTLNKWVRRFEKRGLRGLESLSCAPKRRRASTIPFETVSLVVSARREHPYLSKHKIAVVLRRDHGVAISASSVGRILKRKGLYDEKASRKRRKAAKRGKKKLRAGRWMKDAFPGSLVQVDTKHLPFLGSRCYQFTAVDSFTRLSFIRIYGSVSSGCGEKFLSELTEFMPFPIMGIQTDNGSEYLKRFDKACEEVGIEHYFTHPNCPKENARVERKIQTTKYELWDYRDGYAVEELNRVADEGNESYNHFRPHQSLSYLTPVEFCES